MAAEIPGFSGIMATGWSPLMFIGALAIVLMLVIALRSFGKKGFKEGKFRADAFLSGNEPMEKHDVKASNFFWGFFEAFKGYYEKMLAIHTGFVNDYIFWFLFCVSLLLIALCMGVSLWA
ncbi:MAG: hydrogenase [Candidatus Diapherotrites archaeon]|nr:hydrogenase [Candidatus Diapherotrites archaeon]